jgi:hypothetical protein
MFTKDRRDGFIHRRSARPRNGHPAHLVKRLGNNPTGFPHHVDLARAL